MNVMKKRASKTFSYSVFYEQTPEGGYVAFVPALPGCHTQGETLEEAERNVKEAIALYMESLSAHGETTAVQNRTGLCCRLLKRKGLGADNRVRQIEVDRFLR
jgi:predicted RNase H-like HicB family nuclease